MLKTRATFLLFLVVVLAVQLFAQNSNRWNFPITKLQPNKEAVKSGDYQPVRVNTNFNNNPIRTVTTDNTYVVFPNVIPVPNPNGSQSEVHIAINPNNPNIVLAGSNAANIAVTYLNQGWYVTTNGGTSWYGNDSLPPPPGANYRSDPVVGFDLFGNMYFNTLDYGSTDGDVVTMKSTNNGLTWTKYTIPNPGPDEDKNWFTVDVNTTSPNKNNLYTAYTEFGLSGPSPLEFSRSTDLGLTWSIPINMSGSAGYLHQGVNLTTGPEGQVYAAYTYYPTSTLTSSYVTFAKSTDAGLTFTNLNSTPLINDIRGNLIKGGNSVRVNSFPYIACDRSNGARKGHIYITYAARAVSGQAPDVYLVKSTNQGATWSTPKRINADTALTNRDQWFPAVAVDPADGSVNIVYYDSRNYAANDSTEVYLSRSNDGGNTFEDVKISTSAHKPLSISGLATGYTGDYIGIDAKNGIVRPIWADNRTGKYQAYTAKVFFIQILHPQLTNTENLAGPYKVGARITSSNPIAEAKVYWRRGTSGAFDSLTMVNVAATDSFYANIPGNGVNNTNYQYYIYVKDNVGAFATLPGDAPSTLFNFTAATDIVLPVVTHTALGNQFRETWAPTVNANVTDNIGVDSVRVNYKINFNGTSRQFYLGKVGATDNYTGVFNVDTTLLKVGDTVYYRITAKDKATTPNYGYHPSATTFNAFKIVADTSKPVITHTNLRDQAKVRWPASVMALATDNIRVDSVWVEWYKNNTGNSKRFNLVKGLGDNWTGNFNSDTNQVVVGDSIFYRLVARDGSNSKNLAYLPLTGYFKFKIISAKGLVLVVDDDLVLQDRYSDTRVDVAPDLDSPLGVSATMFKSVLDSVGYLTEVVAFSALDTTTLNNYNVLILSAGTKTATMFNDVNKRNAFRVFAAKPGNKTLVEGGEVGYIYRSSGTTDPLFRQEILFTEAWVTDASGSNLMKKLPGHPINNGVTDNLAFTGTGYGVRDGMKVLPGSTTFPTSTWSGSYVDSGGVIVHDKNPNPVSADNIFFTFAVNAMNDVASARKLIENAVDFLTSNEAPPTGSIAGTVTLTGAANNANARVYLSKTSAPTVRLDSVITGNSGGYAFNTLYAGNYRVTVIPPAGYTPASLFKDTVVTTLPIVNVNFAFTPIASNTTVTGTVTVTGAPDNSGVTVTVVGQAGKTATTNAAGLYTITGVTPGPIKVTFVKATYKNIMKDTTISNGQTLTLNVTMVVGLNEFFYDFEADNGGFTGDNDWQWGTSTKTGGPVAHSGVKLWATLLAANYTNGIKSSLKTASLNLAGFTNVTLSFWHWYDIEAKTVDTTSYDGGNVKVSTDNGVTWTLVNPAGGYPSRIDYTGNPMNGEKCYAGSKMFWQLAEFSLSAYANKQILISFDFGTDPSVNKIGWFVDDVKVEDKLLLSAPKNLATTGGFNKKVVITWQAPTELNRGTINNSLSNLSNEEEMNKTMQEANSIQPNINPSEPQIESPLGFLGYRVYRKSVFDATYGSHIAQLGTTVTTYVDTPLVNDTIYNYVVKSLYDEGLSNPTNEITAGGYIVPDTIITNKMTVVPVIDGIVNPTEWVDAKMTTLTLGGIGGRMFTKYDTLNRKFYAAVINFKDKTANAYDQIGIYFNNNKTGVWANDTSDGNYWIARVGDTAQVSFRGIVGSTPIYVAQAFNPTGVKAKIGFTGGFVSYEIEINQPTAKFTGYPGSVAGVWAYCANGDGSTSTNTGTWPESGVFNMPTTFGTFKFPGSIAPVTVPVAVTTGWNLISVPFKLANMAPSSVFPTSTSKAFYYVDAAGYLKADTLRHALGYWLKFPGATSVNLTGSPVYSLDIPVVAGWNLIGALHGQFPVSGITTNPGGLIASSFFGYSGGVYSVVTNIDKGKGFWVRTSGAGTLKLGVGSALAKEVNTYNELVENKWTTIVITDANGVQGRLFLSSKASLEGKFDLPPVPPTGVSDIRFANNKYVDDISGIQHIINMNSLTYPITVRIENSEANFRVKDLVGGSVVNTILKSGNSVQITNSAINGFSVETVVLPEKFELAQNYPNPFNPSTRIKFAIPENSVVKLQVFNTLGEKVAELLNKELEAGYYDMTFDASKMATGVYIYRLDAGTFSSVKKMMLVK